MSVHPLRPHGTAGQEDDEPVSDIDRLWDASFDSWGEFDPQNIAPYEFFYGRDYLNGTVSGLIGDTDIGKSRLALTEAIAMATGRNLLGVEPAKPDGYPLQVLYWNGEEPLAELQRRAAAICQHYRIKQAELRKLILVSGLDAPMKLAKPGPGGIEFNENVLDGLYTSDFDVILIDPLISAHSLGENDNVALDAVIKRLGKLAATGPKRHIRLVHHIRKPGQGGHAEATLADSRGASSVPAALRAVSVANRMTDAEATRAGVVNPEAYFRIDRAKGNYTAAIRTSAWFRHVSVTLPNGDEVGVVEAWQFPSALDGVTDAHVERICAIAREGQYRSDARATDWIGRVVADVLDLDADKDIGRIKELLKAWYGKGTLKKVARKGPDRHVHQYVEPGDS